jgi:hypothetical protein
VGSSFVRLSAWVYCSFFTEETVVYATACFCGDCFYLRRISIARSDHAASDGSMEKIIYKSLV